MSIDVFKSIMHVLCVFIYIFSSLFQCKNKWNDINCVKPLAGVLASAQTSVEVNDVKLCTFTPEFDQFHSVWIRNVPSRGHRVLFFSPSTLNRRNEKLVNVSVCSLNQERWMLPSFAYRLTRGYYGSGVSSLGFVEQLGVDVFSDSVWHADIYTPHGHKDEVTERRKSLSYCCWCRSTSASDSAHRKPSVWASCTLFWP